MSQPSNPTDGPMHDGVTREQLERENAALRKRVRELEAELQARIMITGAIPPPTAVTPPLSAVTPPLSAVTPPLSAVTPPPTAATPPFAAVTPPLTAVTPPLTAVTPPFAAVTPPLSAVTPPLAAVTPPLSAVTPPLTAVTPPPTAVPPPHAAAAGPSFEQLIGRRVVPIVGAVAVLGAVGFLVSYAIEVGFFGRLSTEIRFGIGILISVALLAAGEVVRRRSVAAAAVGLDAAGVGALMVTIAVGVFVLELFTIETGALLALAAGVFGAAWSVRTNSAVVGFGAALGSFALPATFGLHARSPMLGGLLITVALATGLGMHALGGRRFTVVRWLSLLLLLITALIWASESREAMLNSSMFLVWFALLVGEASLAAIRGRSARGNVVMIVIAAVGACVVQCSAWGWTWGIGWSPIDPYGWFPLIGGAFLFVQSLLLRGFATPRGDGSEEGDEACDEACDKACDTHGIESGDDGQASRAITAACGLLSRTSNALGIALTTGGVVYFLPFAVQSLALASIVFALTLCARRTKSLAFDLCATVFAPCALVLTFAAVVQMRSNVPWVQIPLLFGGRISLWADEVTAAAIGAAMVLMAATSLRVRIASDILRTLCACLAWIVASIVLTRGDLFSAAVALPAIVVGCTPRARRLQCIASLVVFLPSAIVWCVQLFDNYPNTDFELSALNLFPLAAGAMLASSHRSLGVARRFVSSFALLLVAGAVSLFAACVGARRGFSSGDIAIAFTTALALFAIVVILIGQWRRRTDLVEGGALTVACVIVASSLTGLACIFGQAPMLELTAWSAFASVGVNVLATVVASRALARADNALRNGSKIVLGIGAAGIVPIGALPVAACFVNPLAAFAASAWIVCAGITEIAIGFKRGIPLLRWAGLGAFALIVARLYFIDLAHTPTLVRVALLFVTGIVLVGVGIIYARKDRDNLKSDKATETE